MYVVLKPCCTKPSGYRAASQPKQGCRGAGKTQSPTPTPIRVPTPVFCFRGPSLLREKLCGLKQLEYPWESGTKTVLETAGQGQVRALAGQALRKAAGLGVGPCGGRAGGAAWPRSQGKQISQPAPCAKVSLTLLLASLPSGRKCHILMRCDREDKGRSRYSKEPSAGQGRPSLCTDLLYKPHPFFLILSFPI